MLKQEKICRAEHCGKKGTIVCSECDIVYYCSTYCRDTDWITHRDVCYTALNERLIALYRLAVEYDFLGDGFNLSETHMMWSGSDDPYNDQSYSEVGAFASKELSCACCDNKHWDGLDLYTGFVCFEGVTLNYSMCTKCVEEERRLCDNTLCEKTLCKAKQAEPLIRILFYMKYMVGQAFIATDVLHYTMTLLIDTMSCEGCK